MRRFVAVLVLAAVPASAFACAMPHYDEKKLAEVMKQIDAAQTQPAPNVAVPPAPVVPAAEPAATTPPSVIPEVTVPAKPAS